LVRTDEEGIQDGNRKAASPHQSGGERGGKKAFHRHKVVQAAGRWFVDQPLRCGYHPQQET